MNAPGRHASIAQNQSAAIGWLETARRERNAGDLRVIGPPRDLRVIDPRLEPHEEMQARFRTDDLELMAKPQLKSRYPPLPSLRVYPSHSANMPGEVANSGAAPLAVDRSACHPDAAAGSSRLPPQITY